MGARRASSTIHHRRTMTRAYVPSSAILSKKTWYQSAFSVSGDSDIVQLSDREEAIQGFENYIDRYFKPTIFAATVGVLPSWHCRIKGSMISDLSLQCNAWWKYKRDSNGRLLATWLGSQLHGAYVMNHPP
ncbi:hypothetical protein BJX64DRAFT_270152 [Aspergillus heterothallicus]